MRLTVLGCAGSHPGPGRACSSYLVEEDGYRLLLDCGNGSLANLLQVRGVRDLDAIVLSHRHPDLSATAGATAERVPASVISTPSSELRAEIAIVGSGPGGAITACLLAEAGRDVDRTLDEAERLQAEAKWSEAVAALTRAESQLDGLRGGEERRSLL